MEKRYKYTLDEFKNHYAAMAVVGKYKEVVFEHDSDKPPLIVGEEKGFEAQVLRIMDYRGQIYQDRDERIYKAVRLHSALNYVSSHIKAFEKSGLAYVENDPNKPSWVSSSVVCAVYKVFCCPRPPTRPRIQRVIKLAKDMEKD